MAAQLAKLIENWKTDGDVYQPYHPGRNYWFGNLRFSPYHNLERESKDDKPEARKSTHKRRYARIFRSTTSLSFHLGTI